MFDDAKIERLKELRDTGKSLDEIAADLNVSKSTVSRYIKNLGLAYSSKDRTGIAVSKRRLTQEQFIERSRVVHGDTYDYSKVHYVNNSTKVEIICPIHGSFWQTPNKHMSGRGCTHPGCIQAKKKKVSLEHDMSFDEFLTKAREVHGDRYDYSQVDYRGSRIKVCVICPDHGEFWVKPSEHITGKGCNHKDCVTARRIATMRRKYGVDHSLQSKTCLDKARKTCMKRYGASNAMQSDIGKERFHKTMQKKYGVDWANQSDEIHEKIQSVMNERYGGNSAMCDESVRELARETNLERYGVSNVMQSSDIRKKQEDTMMDRYGVSNAMSIPEVREKVLAPEVRDRIKQTNQERYGADYGFSSEIIQSRLRKLAMERYGVPNFAMSSEIQAKIHETMQKNGTFSSSKPEDQLYDLLVCQFGESDVKWQYCSDDYPYYCDFYISSRSLYIELNGSWTHGGHWFDDSLDKDRGQLISWKKKAKTSTYYERAIYVWTNLDLRKRTCARDRGLNYIAFWDCNLSDVYLWFSFGCPDGQDWKQMYSWMPSRMLED